MPGADKAVLLAPLKPARNRTADVIERIGGEIARGRLAPGTRLPTEGELMLAMGVSRTVVREAIAALKADGLVVTRQGSGAFVGSDPTRMAFRIGGAHAASIAAVLDVLELRLAIEVEAAALAARRRSAKALRAIERACAGIDRARAARDLAVAEDFAFHLAIADATGNPLYRQFLTFLGRHIIPRQTVRTAIGGPDEQAHYLAVLQREHHAIMDAIRAGDPVLARRAMRAHLDNSLERYRSLASQTAM